ncbi:peptidase G1 domain-containing protein [Phanerochaete sordida]|uniref:Peptidase G1 domain-containing protein n=1 Tax=Phanerochaete sordida TaxID=48140 RepID=A0A9P3GJV8_9APHY|nr:peptidase G1 domain-containing protein [Phanerochaete sordida]
MRFLPIATVAVLATAVFAIPTTRERFAARMARRANGTATSPHVTTFDASTARRSKYSSRPKMPNATHIQYSGNWAGVVLSEAAGTWGSVAGTVSVPVPSDPTGGGVAAASAWVGIDGDTCQNAIWQTGIDMIYEYGEVYYQAWYEWYPDYAYDYGGITISAGDSVTLQVWALSTTSGLAQIENLSNGQTVELSISSPYALCEQDVEWIVEDFEDGGELVPFANFGSVEFSTTIAATNAATYAVPGANPASANVLDIEQNGRVLTSVAIDGWTITVNYI